jgi:hypothetical protein
MHTHAHNIVSSPSVLCVDTTWYVCQSMKQKMPQLVWFFPYVTNFGRYADRGGQCRVALLPMLTRVQFTFPLAWFELSLWRHREWHVWSVSFVTSMFVAFRRFWVANRRVLDHLYLWTEMCSEVVFRRVREIAKSDYWLRHACLSVRMKQFGSHRTDFNEIWHLSIFGKFAEKIGVSLKADKSNGYLHKDQCTCLIISQRLIPRMKNVSDKSCRERTHILCAVTFFFLLKIV